MRASLLASAIASTLRCSRFFAASIQGLSPWRSHTFGLISTTQAACTNTAQVPIASLRDFAEDGAIPGRYLPGDEPQPRGKVAALGECFSIADRGHHRAGDDRADAGNAHQPLTADFPTRDGLDLA
jgi:hypothetical protein